MRIALFATCLADTLFPDVPRATVTLLERLGHEVVFPAEQTCCGQMHVNTGYRETAVPLVRQLRRRRSAAYEAVVAPSASCVGSVRDQHAARGARPGDAGCAPGERVRARRTFELSEFLVDRLGVEDVGAYLPAPGHLPPDLPLAAAAAGR